MPVFKELYARVAAGDETHRVITSCGKKNYKEQLGKELAKMGNSEMWQAGKTTRSLRPNKKEAAGKTVKAAAGTGGRQSN
jgi:ketol-acid reductoisomerase